MFIKGRNKVREEEGEEEEEEEEEEERAIRNVVLESRSST
jgi:hypothetical protein